LPSSLDLRRTKQFGDEEPGGIPSRRRVPGRWWLVGFGWVAVVTTAFVLGYLLAAHDARHFSARIQTLQTERDLLSERLAAQREALVKLERSHQIDVEALRAAQTEIAALDDARLRLEQRLARLKALVAAGDQGVVEVESLALSPVGNDAFDYRLTLLQIIPEVEQATGEVVLSLVSRRAGEQVVTPLMDLSDGPAGRHRMAFRHLAVFEGRFNVADVGEPLHLVVEIVPKDDNLLSSKQVIPWGAALEPAQAAQVESATVRARH
jgi:hypothetical protein